MRRVIFLPLIIVLAMLLSGCSTHLGLSRILGGGGGASASGGATAAKATKAPNSGITAISIAKGQYRPKNMTIKVGTTLTWTNDDSVPESVTSDAPGLFDSGSIAPGATFSQAFPSAGTFPYHSTVGTTIYGSITVTP
jgi:plastocyanin